MKYDFGGYVTKNDIRCSDGRTIRHGAFQGCDGKRVPLVWNHQHDSVDNVLGFVDLATRPDGVYGKAQFNNTPSGNVAKEIVKHSDVAHMSIMANQLKQSGLDVIHGVIREVSLVLAGANPGAVIDNVSLAHGDGTYTTLEEEAFIDFGINIEHAEPEEEEVVEEEVEIEEEPSAAASKEETVGDVLETYDDDQMLLLQYLLGVAIQKGSGDIEHADMPDAGDTEEIEFSNGQTAQEVWDSMTEVQQQVALALIQEAIQNGESYLDQNDVDDDIDYDEGVEHDMKMKNIFENDIDETDVLEHADVVDMFDRARKGQVSSLKQFIESEGYGDPVLQHGETLMHGITNIESLFPEAQALNNEPYVISRRMEWVDGILNGVSRRPFSKIKSTAVNLTADEARARGYIKGKQKVEEQITALKRVTGPTTVYKLQKIDRDDVIDITDFDVVMFMKNELKVMLSEEVARAILVGDGRPASSNDKINEDCVRPVWTDSDTYCVHSTVPVSEDATDTERAKAFIDAVIRARKNYKGSGSPALYVGSDLLTEMRLLRDDLGYRLYKNDQELADELRVSKIVEIELFDGLTRSTDDAELEFGGIVLNIKDYIIGSNPNGQATLFDDFDLNFNKLEYLLEQRMSGALAQPMSALSIDFEIVEELEEPETPQTPIQP